MINAGYVQTWQPGLQPLFSTSPFRWQHPGQTVAGVDPSQKLVSFCWYWVNCNLHSIFAYQTIRVNYKSSPLVIKGSIYTLHWPLQAYLAVTCSLLTSSGYTLTSHASFIEKSQ